MCVVFGSVNMNIRRVHILVRNGPVLHGTVGSFLPTKEAQRQGRVRAGRGGTHSNRFLLKPTTFWCFWARVLFPQSPFSSLSDFPFQQYHHAVLQWPLKALYNAASHSLVRSHTDGGVNPTQGVSQLARSSYGEGVLLRDTSALG